MHVKSPPSDCGLKYLFPLELQFFVTFTITDKVMIHDRINFNKMVYFTSVSD